MSKSRPLSVYLGLRQSSGLVGYSKDFVIMYIINEHSKKCFSYFYELEDPNMRQIYSTVWIKFHNLYGVFFQFLEKTHTQDPTN